MLLTLSVSFGKNIQPFMYVTFIGDKGGRFLRLNKLQGAFKWQRKEKKQLRKKLLLEEKQLRKKLLLEEKQLRKKLLLREEKLLLRKRKKQLRKEKDNHFFVEKT